MITRLHRSKAHQPVEKQQQLGPQQWTHIQNPNAPEIDRISDELKLEASLLHDATDLDEMPRFEIEDGKPYLYARYAFSEGSRIETAPVLFVIDDADDIFVSLTTRPFNQLSQLLDQNPQLTTLAPKKMLLSSLNACLQSYATQLAPIGRQIRTSRNSLRDEQFSNKHFVRFVEIEDVLNDFLSELVPINNILLHLLAGRKTLQYGENDRDILEDLQLEAAQLIDEIKGYLKTIVNIREAYSNIMTNNLNRQIKILTTLTIVLTIPMIVSSFFGMNVDVPLDAQKWAFGFIAVTTVSLAMGVLYLLRRNGWL